MVNYTCIKQFVSLMKLKRNRYLFISQNNKFIVGTQYLFPTIKVNIKNKYELPLLMACIKMVISPFTTKIPLPGKAILISFSKNFSKRIFNFTSSNNTNTSLRHFNTKHMYLTFRVRNMILSLILSCSKRACAQFFLFVLVGFLLFICYN